MASPLSFASSAISRPFSWVRRGEGGEGRAGARGGGGVEGVGGGGGWGAEGDAAGRRQAGCLGSLLWLHFPRLSEPKLPGPPLHSFHHPWTMRSRLETDVLPLVTECGSGLRPKVSEHPPTPWRGRLGSRSPMTTGGRWTVAVEYREPVLCDAR